MVDPKLLTVCIVCFDVLDIKDFYYQTHINRKYG